MRNENEMYSKIFRRIREDRRLTQYQMAELAECSLRNYQNIEAGISQPSYRTLNNSTFILEFRNYNKKILYH